MCFFSIHHWKEEMKTRTQVPFYRHGCCFNGEMPLMVIDDYPSIFDQDWRTPVIGYLAIDANWRKFYLFFFTLYSENIVSSWDRQFAMASPNQPNRFLCCFFRPATMEWTMLINFSCIQPSQLPSFSGKIHNTLLFFFLLIVCRLVSSRGSGKEQTACSGSRPVLQGGLCYPRCRSGYSGKGKKWVNLNR